MGGYDVQVDKVVMLFFISETICHGVRLERKEDLNFWGSIQRY